MGCTVSFYKTFGCDYRSYSRKLVVASGGKINFYRVGYGGGKYLLFFGGHDEVVLIDCT